MYVCVSAGMFPQKKKCISMHAEKGLWNHGIHLVVARHFHCLHKFKVVHVRVALRWAMHAEMSLIKWCFCAWVKYPYMETRSWNGDREMH